MLTASANLITKVPLMFQLLSIIEARAGGALFYVLLKMSPLIGGIIYIVLPSHLQHHGYARGDLQAL
jgi:hypothetical protein